MKLAGGAAFFFTIGRLLEKILYTIVNLGTTCEG
jgi:hypothetical protein